MFSVDGSDRTCKLDFFKIGLFILMMVTDGRKTGSGASICGKGNDVETPYYRPLQNCISGTRSRRWIPIEQKRTWPSRSNLNKTELAIYGNVNI